MISRASRGHVLDHSPDCPRPVVPRALVWLHCCLRDRAGGWPFFEACYAEISSLTWADDRQQPLTSFSESCTPQDAPLLHVIKSDWHLLTRCDANSTCSGQPDDKGVLPSCKQHRISRVPAYPGSVSHADAPSPSVVEEDEVDKLRRYGCCHAATQPTAYAGSQVSTRGPSDCLSPVERHRDG